MPQLPAKDKFEAAMARSMSAKAMLNKPVKQPSSTNGMALAQKRRREEIEAKKAAEAAKAKEEQARLEKS